jgi:predicted NAD/FAD-binding protein
MRRYAVIGSGVAGLMAAHTLSEQGVAVTLFEAGPQFGGHANTVDLSMDGITHGVDTGFLVYNERTYPGLIALFESLGVVTAPSDMSFSVQAQRPGSQHYVEWSGTSLGSVFAQKRNLFSPRFWRMLGDIFRFNRLATALANQNQEAALTQTVGHFLTAHRFGEGFVQDYFLPMIACIWSCPPEQMRQFPVATLIRFCHNHGLLQVTNRPQWRTVKGGSRHYVNKIVAGLADARRATPVLAVHRRPLQGQGAVTLILSTGQEHFNGVVFACHPDQALALLGNGATAQETEVLGAIRYQANTAVLHVDSAVLPTQRSAWAAWNYERSSHEDPANSNPATQSVCLHYLLNQLQPLPWRTPVVVSLNPIRPIAPEKVLHTIAYEHPVFDGPAIAAQQHLEQLQGQHSSWFCGAWCGYGFHEDGLQSGLAAATAIAALHANHRVAGECVTTATEAATNSWPTEAANPLPMKEVA